MENSEFFKELNNDELMDIDAGGLLTFLSSVANNFTLKRVAITDATVTNVYAKQSIMY